MGVLSFCPLLSKTSLFLLKRRSAEYFLNQSVPTNKAALGASMTIRSTGTLASAMAKGAPRTKPITFFLAWSTATILLTLLGPCLLSRLPVQRFFHLGHGRSILRLPRCSLILSGVASNCQFCCY